MEAQAPGLLAMAHLVVLALWGGVVATEAVVEVLPFRRPELHPAAIRFHTWIDLLVELPLVLAVVGTGAALALTVEPLTTTHLVKIGFAGAAVAVNLFCIAVVLRRGRRLDRSGGDDAPLWRGSRIVLACFAAGLACAAVAATLGFRLALEHLG
ncbi:MAG TPA: hypothetical protein VLT32_12660 [Candidatus Sulfomarinibacteraceae bacterium]|nr:hypothetical protein [Candidatus Sulfomarinibacteraceae bacterium]